MANRDSDYRIGRGRTLLRPPVVCHGRTANVGGVVRLGNVALHWE